MYNVFTMKKIMFVLVLLLSGCSTPDWYVESFGDPYTQDGCQWVRGTGNQVFHYDKCNNPIHKK